LRINGDNSAAIGAISVSANATLGGGGILGGNVTVAANGTISPGNSLGALVLQSNVTINENGILRSDLATTGPATPGNTGGFNSGFLDFDDTAVRTLSLNDNVSSGIFTINLFDTNSSMGAGTYTVTLARLNASGTNDGVLLDRTSVVTAGSTIDPLHYSVNQSNFGAGINIVSSSLNYVNAGSSNLLQLTFTTTPEPHHLLLVCSAVLAFGLLIRRRLRVAQAI